MLHQRALAIASREPVRLRMGNALAACTPPRKDGYDVYISYYYADETHGKYQHLALVSECPSKMLKSQLRKYDHRLSIFLDVDDLDDANDVEAHLDRSSCIVAFVTEAYLRSSNCMREMSRAVEKRKRIIAVVDPKADLESLKRAVAEGASRRRSVSTESPQPSEIALSIFAETPILWDRTTLPLQLPAKMVELIVNRIPKSIQYFGTSENESQLI